MKVCDDETGECVVEERCDMKDVNDIEEELLGSTYQGDEREDVKKWRLNPYDLLIM